MGGLLGDLESLWNSVTTTGQTVFHDLEDAVNQLTSLGVPAFPDMKAFIQLLVAEGENPFTFLPNLVGHITSRGGNVVSTLEELANGFLQEGPHNYVSRQTSKVINPIINIVQQHTQTATALGTLHQSTITQIQTKLTTLSQGSPGTIPFQGQAALSIQSNFTTAATSLNTLAAPMNSTTTSTSSSMSDPGSTFQDTFASINQGFVSGLQEIPNMTQQFVLFDLGVLGVELIIGGAVALPTVGLGDAVEIPLAGGIDVIILAAELLTVAVWFVGDLLVWAIRVIVALVVLGVQEIIYHVQSPSTTTSTSTTTTHPISITVISGGASQGGETVITNGDGTGADAGGWSTDDQADLAWTAATACAAARASYIKRTGNGNINYALGLLSLDGSPMPPETYGPILGVGSQDTHSEQVIVNYWKNIRLPQLRSHVKPTGSNLVLMIFTRNQMCPGCNGMIPTWIQELAAAIGPGVTIHFYLWQSINPYNPPGPGNLEPVPGA